MASHVESTVSVPPQVAHEHPTLAWIEKHRKPVTYGAVALAVVAVGTWLFMETGRRKEIAAADAIDRARAAFESGNLPAASSEFQRVAETFSGTEAGFQAELALNDVRLAGGQTQIAADELLKFAERNPPAYYAAGAYLLRGGALENLKKFDEASAAYRRAAEIATEDYRQVEALIGAARASRLGGKEKEAQELLRGILSKYKESTPGVAEAAVRLAEWTRGAM